MTGAGITTEMHTGQLPASVTTVEMEEMPRPRSPTRLLTRIEDKIEEKGATRISEEDRKVEHLSGFRTFLFWFGYDFNSFNITIGVIGSLNYMLNSETALLMALLAITCGSIPVGWISCLGPKSGLRTMLINRFVVGWYPAKALSVLCTLMLLIYTELDIVASANLVAALWPASQLAPIFAIFISGAFCIALAMFGVDVLQFWQQHIWFPQLLAVCTLAGTFISRAAHTKSSRLQPEDTGDFAEAVRFFSFIFSAVTSYSVTAADYWVYYREDTSQKQLFLCTVGGIWSSSVILIGTGIGLGTIARGIPEWHAAFEQSPATLFVKVSSPLGALGSTCCLLLALGNLSFASGGMYSQALALQSIGGSLERISRAKCTAAGGSVALLAAIAARNSLVVVLQGSIAVIGYWVGVWLTILACECLTFSKVNYFWETWNEPKEMVKGYAASAAFLTGITIAILSMAEPWFVGPIAQLGGPKGINVRHDRLLSFIHG